MIARINVVSVIADVSKKSVSVSCEKAYFTELMEADEGALRLLASKYGARTATSLDTVKGISSYRLTCKSEEDVANLYRELRQFFFEK